MLARIRISVPDRPGSLGRIASVIGSAGGDIAEVDVLESEAGRALDDVFVTVRDRAQLDRVTQAIADTAGVTLVGVQQPAPPVTGHTEWELVQQVLSNPSRGLITLVDGAPGALGADWAALIEFGMDGAQQEVLAVSGRGPDPEMINLTAPLRLAAIQLSPAPGASVAEAPAGVVLVPLVGCPIGLLLVREAGVDFHRSELWRLGQLGAIVGPGINARATMTAPQPAPAHHEDR